MTVHEMRQRLEELGTDKTQPLYQRPWAMASDTPFRFYKLWPYRGGVQTPFIVSWPAEIRAHGLRRQFVDMIDITPTVLDIADVEAPPVFEGVCEIPLQGKSIRATFNNPESPNPRNTQYFELWGSRGIWHDGWEAVGIHRPRYEFRPRSLGTLQRGKGFLAKRKFSLTISGKAGRNEEAMVVGGGCEWRSSPARSAAYATEHL